jgi:hypothetical protein
LIILFVNDTGEVIQYAAEGEEEYREASVFTLHQYVVAAAGNVRVACWQLNQRVVVGHVVFQGTNFNLLDDVLRNVPVAVEIGEQASIASGR